jgi:branched-chain amino acid transport system substrate-binding protein
MSDRADHDAITEDDLTNLRLRALVAILASLLATVLALSEMSGAATAGSDEGVTDKSVKIGFISSKTGVASATTATSEIGCKARVARENAHGGVNGREIQVEYVDDQSSGANLTGAQDLVQNKHVYMIVNNSAFAFLTYRWLLDNHIPVIGGGYDGIYYGTPGNEKVISGLGNQAPVTGVTTDLGAKIMKRLGAKKVAALGYGISPSSSNAAKAFNQYAVPSVGLEPVYTNTTVDFGTTDVAPLVLGIKNAGADGAYYAMVANTNLAIVQGLKQNGVNMKANIMATGYGQQLLDQPIANQLGPSVIFAQGWQPVELKSKATKRLQADLKQYANFTGIPDFGIYTGYTDCDLAITGLKQQGNHLDRSTYTNAIRNLKQVNPAGLNCQPLAVGLDTYGKASPENCQYAMYVKDGKFQVLKPKNSNKPYWTGKLIGRSVTEATTTTAAPAQ